MKQKWLALPLALLLLCASCSPAEQEETSPPEGEYGVYFLRGDQPLEGRPSLGADSGYLGREFHPIPEREDPEQVLLGLLMAGPEEEGLISPFPAGTRVRSWRREESRVSVDLSEAYSGLAGVELSLADGCIVLTLCQLEGVEEVYITVEGRPRPFRDQVLRPGDFIESNRFDLLPQPTPEEALPETDAPTPEPVSSEE